MNKKNLPLILALSIPILMIILVAAFIYFPGVGKKPKVNFLYATGTNVAYGYGSLYSVNNGGIVENIYPENDPYFKYSRPVGDVQLYIYNVETNESKEITFEESKKLKLDPSAQSSDGYEVVNGNSGGDGLFFGGSGDSNHKYLRGHNRSRQLNLKLAGAYYYGNFQFLGWVVN